MIIHIYTIVRNEEYILPYFLRHYETFVDKIFVIDDHSTDKTAEIAKAHPKVEYSLYDYDKDENYDDHFSECFTKQYKKHSRGIADWVIRVDADEFMYNKDILVILKEQQLQKVDVIKSLGYFMVSKVLPTCEGQIYNECNKGVRYKGYDKTVIFNPKIDITFTKGRHNIITPKDTVITNTEICLLHYRYLSRKYFIQKSTHLYSRKGEMSIELKNKLMEKGLKWYEQCLESDKLIKII